MSVTPHPPPRRSGSPLDPEADPSSHKLSAAAPHYLLIDTNVALHQVRVRACSDVRVRVCLGVFGRVWKTAQAGIGKKCRVGL